MIKIDLQSIYLDEVKENDLFCLIWLDTKVLGCRTRIFKTFKTFQGLKQFCEDNSSDLQLSVCNMSKEEVEKIQKDDYDFDYSNID